MEISSLSFDEVLSTTRAVRLRLDFERTVPREVLMDCLRLAVQAPSASDSQDWEWIFVDDPAKKAAIADVYRANRAAIDAHSASVDTNETPTRIARSGSHLVDHMQDAPFLLIPCQKGRAERGPAGMGATFWASVIPATWSFCLALRSRGLGTCWTTLHLFGGGEKKVAEILGVPYDEYSQVGLFPIAYTKGTDFKPAARLPPEHVSHWNSW
ncbi:nitroreductase [Mycobacterium sp. Root265]|uniref:nitroreductase family protein n=1 Tax=Mycobacterium sp. Root265 TaxID=1736504 RepID=UPI000708AA62|nr:nitroreductase family protein [Mycobacterium sp. Root265]KRD14378.1 nitroreductase [Mycobacterium sp. Root265]